MDKLIAEYQEQIKTLKEMCVHCTAAEKDARKKHRSIEAAKIRKKLELMKNEINDLEYAVRQMKGYMRNETEKP